MSKNNQSALVLHVFVYFFAVISKTATWNDQIQGFVENVNARRWICHSPSLLESRSYQFSSRILRPYCTSWTHWSRAVFNWVSKVIAFLLWFCLTTLCDWLIKLAPLSQPMRCKTKTNRASLARVFPRLAPVTCIYFAFWLVHCAVYTCCDWPE